MPKLVVNTGNGQPHEIQLVAGLNRVGRSGANDIQLDEASVSSLHCEITCNGNSVLVKDLGSTNGTFVNKQRIQEAALGHGQRLQLGCVEMVLDSAAPATAAAGVAEPPKVRLAVQSPQAAPRVATAAATAVPAARQPQSALRVSGVTAPAVAPAEEAVSDASPIAPPIPAAPSFCKFHRKTPGRYACGKCRQSYCELCVGTRPGASAVSKFCKSCGSECVALDVDLAAFVPVEKSFYQMVPGAFAYPFKKNGLFMLICATVLYAVMEATRFLPFISFYRFWGYLLMAGYLCAYMQKVMVYSGQGEQDMPGWPDVSSIWSDVILPFLFLAGTIFACLMPALAAAYFSSDVPILTMAFIPLMILGCFYFPMALLAVGMTDNIFSLNPFVVMPSILKIFPPYLLACLVLGFLAGISFVTQLVMGLIPVPFLPSMITGFLAIYFFTVEMRILGVMYYTNRSRLGWFTR